MQPGLQRLATPPAEEDFTAFYAACAPKLWGLLRLTNLPTAQSERLLVEVLVKAWRHPDRHPTPHQQSVSWLLRLAYAEGMPPTPLAALFKTS